MYWLCTRCVFCFLTLFDKRSNKVNTGDLYDDSDIPSPFSTSRVYSGDDLAADRPARLSEGYQEQRHLDR